jgi:hypothetical protein
MLLLSCCRHSTASSARGAKCKALHFDVSDAESIVKKDLLHEYFCQQTFATGTDATGTSRLVCGSAKSCEAEIIVGTRSHKANVMLLVGAVGGRSFAS